jgi:hypothetical protein
LTGFGFVSPRPSRPSGARIGPVRPAPRLWYGRGPARPARPPGFEDRGLAEPAFDVDDLPGTGFGDRGLDDRGLDDRGLDDRGLDDRGFDDLGLPRPGALMARPDGSR